jgi:hypothetical protein
VKRKMEMERKRENKERDKKRKDKREHANMENRTDSLKDNLVEVSGHNFKSSQT